jgi:hypothetical protein
MGEGVPLCSLVERLALNHGRLKGIWACTALLRAAVAAARRSASVAVARGLFHFLIRDVLFALLFLLIVVIWTAAKGWEIGGVDATLLVVSALQSFHLSP